MPINSEIMNMDLSQKIERSLNLIKNIVEIKDEYMPLTINFKNKKNIFTVNKLPLIINFSGGKDSTAMLLLAKKVTDNIELIYCDGGIDLPLTLDYVKKQAERFNLKLHTPKAGEVKVGHKNLNCYTFADFVLHYGYWPTAGKRWCSTWLKQRVMKAYWRSIYSRKTILYKLNGVRMFESKTRLWKYGDPKHYKRFSKNGSYFLRYDNECKPHVLVYPIIEWTKENIIDFIKSEGIEIHEGYKLFGVSGCKWCPVHKKEIYEKILKVYPEIYDDIIDLENKINRPSVEGGKYWLRDIKDSLNE